MQLSLRDTGACVRKGAYEGRLRLQLGFDGLAFWQGLIFARLCSKNK